MLEPYDNKQLLVLDKVRDKILDNFFDKKLHHSLLFVGDKGLGKATLAYHIANKILDDESSLKENGGLSLFGDTLSDNNLDENNPTFNLIKNKKHPDLLVIEKEVDSKTSKIDKEIKIASARKINDFMSMAPFVAKNKVIIIDAIDEMNTSAQNAILKNLEEPHKNTYILLVCHNINNILETIISRCERIDIQKHSFEDWKKIFEYVAKDEYKKINEENLVKLYNISNSSISLTLDIIENDGLFLYNYIENLLSENELNIENLHIFADKIVNNDTLYSLFKKFILIYLYDVLMYFSNNKIDETFKIKNMNFLLKNSEEKILQKIKFTKSILRDIDIYSLNKKHAVVVLFNELLK